MNERQQLRVLLMTAKVLQFCADIFAVFGIFLFAFVYFNQFHDNDAMAILKDPFFIVTVLLPFLPAAFLAYLAARKRRQVRAMLEQTEKST